MANKKLFLQFLAKAHRNTYAAPPEIHKLHRCKTSILPEHKDFHFSEGDWEYHDSYAGVNWAPGREVVFVSGKPFWAMSYQGKHDESIADDFFQKEAFPFLRKALIAMTDDIPFRGKDGFKSDDGQFEYRFVMHGDWTYFTGHESVFFNGKEIFFQDIMGELIK